MTTKSISVLRQLARALAVLDLHYIEGLMASHAELLRGACDELGCAKTWSAIALSLATKTHAELGELAASTQLADLASKLNELLRTALQASSCSPANDNSVVEILAGMPDVQTGLDVCEALLPGRRRVSLTTLPLHAGATRKEVERFVRSWSLAPTDALDLACWLRERTLPSEHERVAGIVCASGKLSAPVRYEATHPDWITAGKVGRIGDPVPGQSRAVTAIAAGNSVFLVPTRDKKTLFLGKPALLLVGVPNS